MYIKDNSNDPSWPERIITHTAARHNSFRDTEPFAQDVYLDCGHSLINTYGNQYKKLEPGQLLRCRTCGKSGVSQ